MSDEESIFKRKSKKSFCCDKNFIKKKSVWNFHSKFFLNKRNKLRLRNDIKEFEKWKLLILMNSLPNLHKKTIKLINAYTFEFCTNPSDNLI